MKLFTWRRCTALVISAGLIAAATTTSAFASSTTGQTTNASTTASHSAPAAPSSFHGVNWADPNDNYNSGPVVPSGLSTGSTSASK